jgi:hypothetical protein
MDSRSESLFIRNSPQQICELPLFFGRKSGKQSLRMLARNAAYGLQHRASFFRQMQGIPATVAWIVPPFHESRRFHFVNQDNQPAGDHSERFREGLLGDRGSRAKDPQYAGMMGSKIQRCEPLAKFRGCVSAYLR